MCQFCPILQNLALNNLPYHGFLFSSLCLWMTIILQILLISNFKIHLCTNNYYIITGYLQKWWIQNPEQLWLKNIKDLFCSQSLKDTLECFTGPCIYKYLSFLSQSSSFATYILNLAMQLHHHLFCGKAGYYQHNVQYIQKVTCNNDITIFLHIHKKKVFWLLNWP